MRMPALVRVLTMGAATWVACKAAPSPFPDDDRVSPPPVRVTFRPPEGTPIVERLATVRKEEPQTGGEVQSVNATLTSTFRRSGDGWILTQQLSEVRAERGGVAVQSPFLELMTRFPVQVRLAKDGSFVRLANPEDAQAAIRAQFDDPQQAAVVLRYFTPEAIEQQARLEWNGKYGELLEREVLPGHAWYDWETLPLTGGAELSYALERKVKEVRRGARGLELVLALSCPASPEAAANSIALRRLLESREGSELEPTVSCTGEQVLGLDPFLPRSLRLELSAAPKDAGGTPRKLAMTRSVRTEETSATGSVTQEAR
jgi:hypothetical protein